VTAAEGTEPGGIRLNKLLAERVGLARRRCDEAILRGEVSVDGVAVDTPGLVLDPARHVIAFRGEPLPGAPAFHYLMLHKPLGVLVTWSDPQGRPTVKDYVPPGLPRMFAVGRLDADTSGLLVLTNDGALTHRLAHPRYEVSKTYLLTLERAPSEEQLAALREGVDLGEGELTRPAKEAVVVSRAPGGAVVRLVIAEGKNRQVRRMCKAVGLWLTALVRVAFGPLVLADLPAGKTRLLTRDEIRALRAATRDPEEPPRGRTER
jgi:23S rRNA pseudouridine2605 synthase